VTAFAVAAMLGGCGSSTSGTTTENAQLRERQDALVAFVNALVGDLPIRASTRKAMVRFRSDLELHPPDLGGAERAIKESLSRTESWHGAMENLPATSADITPIRTDYSEAAAAEVKELREYLAVAQALATGSPTFSELQRRAEALTAKAESFDIAARKRFTAIVGELGGEPLLRRRIGVKRLQEAAENGLQEKAASSAH
jgi:hypothetical protein